jgi:hypothetical protein
MALDVITASNQVCDTDTVAIHSRQVVPGGFSIRDSQYNAWTPYLLISRYIDIYDLSLPPGRLGREGVDRGKAGIDGVHALKTSH